MAWEISIKATVWPMGQTTLTDGRAGSGYSFDLELYCSNGGETVRVEACNLVGVYRKAESQFDQTTLLMTEYHADAILGRLTQQGVSLPEARALLWLVQQHVLACVLLNGGLS